MNNREEQILAVLGARDTARIEYRERMQAKRTQSKRNKNAWAFQAPKRGTK